MSAKQSSFKNPSRIIGIQFGLFSPEEIRKAGVVEVVSKDTYIGNSEVAGGLFDPRMGVLGPNTICPTDGLTNIMTPGYFGYIELARPVFFIQHLKEIMKILKCVCFKCSKLLISKEQHRQPSISKHPTDGITFTNFVQKSSVAAKQLNKDAVVSSPIRSSWKEWRQSMPFGII
jgi:DNA-directed RNA polymerase beta' subunit